jgi:hypothetical protein
MSDIALEDLSIFVIISRLILPGVKNVSDKICTNTKSTVLNTFFKSYNLKDNYKKCGSVTQAVI